MFLDFDHLPAEVKAFYLQLRKRYRKLTPGEFSVYVMMYDTIMYMNNCRWDDIKDTTPTDVICRSEPNKLSEMIYIIAELTGMKTEEMTFPEKENLFTEIPTVIDLFYWLKPYAPYKAKTS